MRDLVSTRDYLELFWLAAGFGALGGLASELLQQAGGSSGGLRLLRWDRGTGVLSTGVFGSVLVGAVAALTVLVFLPYTKVVEDGVSSLRYELIRLLSVSIGAGVGGSAILGASQARALAAVQTERVRQVAATGIAEVARTGEDLGELVRAAVRGELRGALAQMAAREADAVPGEAELDDAVEVLARRTVAAVEEPARLRVQASQRTILAAAEGAVGVARTAGGATVAGGRT